MTEDEQRQASARVIRRLVGDPPAPYDPINRPEHYASYKIQPAEFIRELDLPFWAGCVVKYVVRESKKNGLEDLKKARKYLSMEIARREGVEKWTDAE